MSSSRPSSRGSVSSLSSIETAPDSKVKLSDFTSDRQKTLKAGLQALKKENPAAKFVKFKGKDHKSSTVKEHTQVVSVQLLDEKKEYLGSAHIDTEGNAYTNSKWGKTKAKGK